MDNLSICGLKIVEEHDRIWKHYCKQQADCNQLVGLLQPIDGWLMHYKNSFGMGKSKMAKSRNNWNLSTSKQINKVNFFKKNRFTVKFKGKKNCAEQRLLWLVTSSCSNCVMMWSHERLIGVTFELSEYVFDSVVVRSKALPTWGLVFNFWTGFFIESERYLCIPRVRVMQISEFSFKDNELRNCSKCLQSWQIIPELKSLSWSIVIYLTQ